MSLTRAKVAAEPCECVYCSMCSGTGRERCGDYMGDSDPCEDCGGSGISEACERCRYLQELELGRIRTARRFGGCAQVTPYYQGGGITLYHGDARDILPSLPDRSIDFIFSVSDSALTKMEKLAEQSKFTGPMQLYASREKKGQVIEIGPTLIEKIEQHIRKASESKGSIIGQLDTIAVHRSNEVRVWEENYGRAVRCEYKPDLEEKIKCLLRHRVIVTGSVYFNAKGQPVSVSADDIEGYPDHATLPTIQEMSGLIDDLTGTQSLKEYMEELSNG